jgi:hypothetical protein
VFLNSNMGPHIAPQGWREWRPGETNYLNTVYYAEFDSRGPGGNTQKRDLHAHLLSSAEATPFLPTTFLGGHDRWNPEDVR